MERENKVAAIDVSERVDGFNKGRQGFLSVGGERATVGGDLVVARWSRAAGSGVRCGCGCLKVWKG